MGKVDNKKHFEQIKTYDGLFNSTHELKNVTFNKVIVVGDSRMEFLNNRGSEINIPVNFNFIALSGTRIDWLTNTAINVLSDKLDKMDSNYKYHVIFNMGVNDLEFSDDAKYYATEYYNIYYNLASKYKEINFYLLSVNPINEEKIYQCFKQSGRTNQEIIDFNNTTINLLNGSDLDNMHYCDSYHNIDFGMPDGLHYDKDTDQRIVNFIANKCIVYE